MRVIVKIQHDNLEDPEASIATLREALESHEWPINDAAYFMGRLAEIYYEDMEDDDTAIEKEGVTLLVDSLSFQYLAGAIVDFKEDLQGSRFVVENPNATTTCGCGNSFSL